MLDAAKADFVSEQVSGPETVASVRDVHRWTTLQA